MNRKEFVLVMDTGLFQQREKHNCTGRRKIEMKKESLKPQALGHKTSLLFEYLFWEFFDFPVIFLSSILI